MGYGSELKKIKNFFFSKACNLIANPEKVNLTELAEVLSTYEGDGGCTAANFFEQIKQCNDENINRLFSAIAKYLDEKLKSLDLIKVTQNIFAAMSCCESRINVEVRKELLKVLKRDVYTKFINNLKKKSNSEFFSIITPDDVIKNYNRSIKILDR